MASEFKSFNRSALGAFIQSAVDPHARGFTAGVLGQFIFCCEGLGNPEENKSLFRYDPDTGAFAAIAAPPWFLIPSLPTPSFDVVGYNPFTGYFHAIHSSTKMYLWKTQAEGWLERSISYGAAGSGTPTRMVFAHNNMYIKTSNRMIATFTGVDSIPASTYTIDETKSFKRGTTAPSPGFGDLIVFNDYLYALPFAGTGESIRLVSDSSIVFTPSTTVRVYIFRMDSDLNWESIPADTIMDTRANNDAKLYTNDNATLNIQGSSLYMGPGQFEQTIGETSFQNCLFLHTGSDTSIDAEDSGSINLKQIAVNGAGKFGINWEVNPSVYQASGGAWSLVFDYDMNTTPDPLFVPINNTDICLLGDFDNVDAVSGGSQYFWNSTDEARLINPDLDTSAGNYKVNDAIQMPVFLTFDDHDSVW